jgi:transcriptional regulator with XRE-family HTH domain
MPRTRDPGDLGGNLRRARKDRSLTQKQLAEAAGVAQATVSKIESGERRDPSLSTIAALERVLSVGLGVTSYHPSLVRFLESDLAKVLAISDAEAEELAAVRWWPDDQAEPSDAEWYDFVRLRRAVAAHRRHP